MNTQMAYLRPTFGSTKDVYEATQSAAQAFQAEPGFVEFTVDLDGDNVAILERWTIETAFDMHGFSPAYLAWRTAIDPLLAQPFKTYPYDPELVRRIALSL